MSLLFRLPADEGADLEEATAVAFWCRRLARIMLSHLWRVSPERDPDIDRRYRWICAEWAKLMQNSPRVWTDQRRAGEVFMGHFWSLYQLTDEKARLEAIIRSTPVPAEQASPAHHDQVDRARRALTDDEALAVIVRVPGPAADGYHALLLRAAPAPVLRIPLGEAAQINALALRARAALENGGHARESLTAAASIQSDITATADDCRRPRLQAVHSPRILHLATHGFAFSESTPPELRALAEAGRR